MFLKFLTGASVTFFGQVALPRETTTGKCFLQHYIESILAFQEASCKMVDGMYSTFIYSGLVTY
jgi:hypothetical protein